MANYYSKQEVLSLLNIPDSTLYQMIRDGRIHPYLPPSRKRGAIYDKKEIDDLVHMQKRGDAKPRTIVFDALTNAELAQAFALDFEVVGDTDLPLWSTLRAWNKRNPQIFYGITDQEHIVVAYFALIPLSEQTIKHYLQDEMQLESIEEEHILRYTLDTCYSCLLHMSVAPNAVNYSEMLRSGLLSVLEALGKQGIELGQVYYKQCLPLGEEMTVALTGSLGFTPVRDNEQKVLGYLSSLQDVRSWLTHAYQRGIMSHTSQRSLEANGDEFQSPVNIRKEYVVLEDGTIRGPLQYVPNYELLLGEADERVGFFAALKRPRGRPRKQR